VRIAIRVTIVGSISGKYSLAVVGMHPELPVYIDPEFLGKPSGLARDIDD
jgi:hypothetical protein